MKNVIVIFGGNSCEKDVSVLTAYSAYYALKQTYNIYAVYIKNRRFYCSKNELKIKEISDFSYKNFDEVYFAEGGMHFRAKKNKRLDIYCVVNCCHGGEGENGFLAGLLETVGIPYTSADPYVSALFMDKVKTKKFIQDIGLPVLPFFLLGDDDGKRSSSMEYPLVVKPSSLGSSIGLSFVNDAKELDKAIVFALHFDEKVLVEKGLTEFTEVSCAALRKHGKVMVGSVERIVTGSDHFDFDAKYRSNETFREIPARIDPALYERVRNYVKIIYEKSGVKGVIRIDFFIKDGTIYVNEVNTIPGSLAAYLFKANGMSMYQIITAMMEESIERFERNKSLITEYDTELLSDFDENVLKAGVKK